LFVIFLVKMAGDLKKDDYYLEHDRNINLVSSISVFIVGLVMLPLGGHLVVSSATGFAHLFGVSEVLIAIFILALGTSLPEFATSIIAAFRRKTDMAIGNIIGSNIFNLLFVLGISSLIRPIKYNMALNFEVLVLFLASLLLLGYLTLFAKKQINKAQAISFIILYLSYLFFVFSRG
ncbi:sodium:calcium antiporter, partial [Candidatus Margulisiibacteriota bacterium]